MSAAPDMEVWHDEPVTARQAARAMGVTPKTVRTWLREGAPVVREGRPGKAALVRVSELRHWREGGDFMERIAQVLLDTHRREADDGLPAHITLGIDGRRAAVLLAHVYDRACHEFAGEPPTSLEDCPEPVRQLLRLAEP